ncbi:MAG: histidine kinase dimerization/phospho-acceptor domain-containing protein [Waddliaceae bacterium]
MNQENIAEFIQSLSHDIKNPLCSIKGFSSLLLQDLKDAPEQQKMANYIFQAVEEIERLLESAAGNLVTLSQNDEPKVLGAKELESAILNLFQRAKSSHFQETSSIVFETTGQSSDKIIIKIPSLKEVDYEH